MPRKKRPDHPAAAAPLQGDACATWLVFDPAAVELHRTEPAARQAHRTAEDGGRPSGLGLVVVGPGGTTAETPFAVIADEDVAAFMRLEPRVCVEPGDVPWDPRLLERALDELEHAAAGAEERALRATRTAVHQEHVLDGIARLLLGRALPERRAGPAWVQTVEALHVAAGLPPTCRGAGQLHYMRRARCSQCGARRTT